MADITEAMVKQFGSNVEQLVQQGGSNLREAVRLETGIVGEDAFFEQLGATAAVLKTTRHGDTPLIDADHQRRRVSMKDYEWATLVDKPDRLKIIIDPENAFAVSAAMAFGRAIDDEIITAYDGAASTGKTGSGSANLDPTDNVIGANATGLNLTKILQAKQRLDDNDVPAEDRIFVLAPEQLRNILNVTEITSSDFVTVKALVQGDLDTFAGFKFITSTRLPVNASSERLNFAYHKTGITLGMAQDIMTRIDERKDKSYSNQVFLSMSIGAVRMEEEKMIVVENVEV